MEGGFGVHRRHGCKSFLSLLRSYGHRRPVRRWAASHVACPGRASPRVMSSRPSQVVPACSLPKSKRLSALAPLTAVGQREGMDGPKLEELLRSECLRLLASVSVGRVGLSPDPPKDIGRSSGWRRTSWDRPDQPARGLMAPFRTRQARVGPGPERIVVCWRRAQVAGRRHCARIRRVGKGPAEEWNATWRGSC